MFRSVSQSPHGSPWVVSAILMKGELGAQTRDSCQWSSPMLVGNFVSDSISRFASLGLGFAYTALVLTLLGALLKVPDPPHERPQERSPAGVEPSRNSDEATSAPTQATRWSLAAHEERYESCLFAAGPRSEETDGGDAADSQWHGDLNRPRAATDFQRDDWRYGRTGWVRLHQETGIQAAPLNWVQRVPAVLWAALLWCLAIWILVWSA